MCSMSSTQTMAKRPVSALGNKRPQSEFARRAAALGGNPRFKVTNGVHILPWGFQSWFGERACLIWLEDVPWSFESRPVCLYICFLLVFLSENPEVTQCWVRWQRVQPFLHTCTYCHTYCCSVIRHSGICTLTLRIICLFELCGMFALPFSEH